MKTLLIRTMKTCAGLLLFLAPVRAAAPPAGALSGTSLINGGQALSAPVQIVILMTLLTLLPAVVMSITPFLRITVVLHFLRQALGTQTTPSNQVLLGLALFLTIAVMQPVAQDVYHQGWEPMEQGKLTAAEAFDAGAKPMRAFLVRFAREKDIQLMLEITHSPAPRNLGR